jgi:hypothetical protein
MNRFDSSLRSRPMVLLNALLGIAKKHNKKYCYVGQEKLRKLVGEFGGIWMSNRTLNRDLRFLEDDNWIERIRRLHKNPEGKIVFACTLYKFKAKVFNALFSIGNSVKRLFLHYRLPCWAEYQLSQKRASSPVASSSVEIVWIKDKVGHVQGWNPRIGEFIER